MYKYRGYGKYLPSFLYFFSILYFKPTLCLLEIKWVSNNDLLFQLNELFPDSKIAQQLSLYHLGSI